MSCDGRFCTAASGIVYDASAVRTYHQNYLSTNASLDGADTWYVWARPSESEEDNESREFFSPIDNAAENRNVNTRNITRTILRAGTTKPDNSVGWARVGKLTFVAVIINNIRRLGYGTVSAITP